MQANEVSRYISQYTIRKGTALYRRSSSRDVLDEMFFAFSPYGTYSSYFRKEPVSLWYAIADINGSLMLKDWCNPYRLKSSIPDIYSSQYPEESVGLMELKKYGAKRDALVSFLKDKNITNWISSVEDKYEMELFLFATKIEIAKLVRYANPIDPNGDYDKMNSFDYTRIESEK